MSDLIKFQWSVKLPNDEIYMIQAETADELALAKTEIETKFLNTPAQPKTTTAQEPRTNTTKYSCNTCGAEANLKEGTSKKGNYYKIMKCSADETHDRFMK